MVVYHPFQNLYFNSFFNQASHKYFEVDYWGLSGRKFLEDILVIEKKIDPIKIGVASYLPLERSIKLLDKNERKKIEIVGQEYENAHYLYSNLISEVDKRYNDKYKIPSNFSKISEFVIEGITVYEIYKKVN